MWLKLCHVLLSSIQSFSVDTAVSVMAAIYVYIMNIEVYETRQCHVAIQCYVKSIWL